MFLKKLKGQQEFFQGECQRIRGIGFQGARLQWDREKETIFVTLHVSLIGLSAGFAF